MQNTQEVQEIEQGQEVQDVSIDNTPDLKLPLEVYEAMAEQGVFDNITATLSKIPYIEQTLRTTEQYPEEWEILGEFLDADKVPDRLSYIPLWDFLPTVENAALNDGISTANLLRKILSGKFTQDGYPTNKRYRAIVERAENKSITVNTKIEKIDYPTDKINNNVWKKFLYIDKNGQLTFDTTFEQGFNTAKKNRKEAIVYYSINFEELKDAAITKALTSYDKRVYIAIGALYNAGYKVITIQQIYISMGNIGRPSDKDYRKINESITKMNTAHIFLHNTHEVQVHKKQKSFVYDGSLLPMERMQTVVNGKVTSADGGIHLFREPPLISFARGRKQITTIKRCLLESPLSQTPENLTLEDYLIENIAYIKHNKGKVGNKMLYDTIFDKCGIKDKVKRHRAKDKVIKYLGHCVKCKYITEYKKEADGVVIYY